MNRELTPLHLNILIHHYCGTPGRFKPDTAVANEYAAELVFDGLLESGDTTLDLRITEMGRAHVASLLRMPYPKSVPVWVDGLGHVWMGDD